MSAARGDVDEAIFWYEEAVRADPGNSALLDRFAFYLSTKGNDKSRAYPLARRACEINQADPECHFTAGHIAASLGDVPRADQYLQIAERLDFPKHRCSLQRARARVRAVEISRKTETPIRVPKGDIEAMLHEAEAVRGGHWLDDKHLFEAKQVRERYDAIT
jgi:tetratricopeptide (TPR) repeat protein